MKTRTQKMEATSLDCARRAGRLRLPRLLMFVCLLSAFAALAGERMTGALAAQAAPEDTAEVFQSLLDLQNPWTVMCVAAHPDDEDGSTLTVLRRKYGVHTVTLFSTYGEGGQNAVGPELYEELGVIRARETREAARIQGSEPYFLGLRDFGFSKSSAEAFRFWGHEEALRRMVLKIRQLRPDVIITNHDTTSGHGHHQATGILVLEAFDAAADPRRFPEQLRGGLTPWQPQRLFVRFQFEGSGSKAAEAEAQRTSQVVAIDRNERDSMRGTTYSEQALRALQQHASQGPWPQTVSSNNLPPIRYRLARSAKNAPPLPLTPLTFFAGMSLSGNLTNALTPLATRALVPLYMAPAHQSILSALVSIRKSGLFATARPVEDEPRFRLMRERLNHALVVASGIRATLAPDEEALVPGGSARIALKLSNEGEARANVRGIRLRNLRPAGGLSFPRTLAAGESMTVELQHTTPRTAALSVPHAAHLYDGTFTGAELAAEVDLEIDGAPFSLEATTRMDVAPAVEIARITPSPIVVTPGARNQPLTFTLHLINHRNQPVSGNIMAAAADVRAGLNAKQAFSLAAREAREVTVSLPPPGDNASKAGFAPGGKVRFRIMPLQTRSPLAEAVVPLVNSEARVARNLRVGYVRSYDDTLRDSLASLGVEATELSADYVRTKELGVYSAIIIDNRGYQAHPELVGANSRLLDYARAGGTLIVFYHKTNEWNPETRAARPQLAPYPITLGNSRVTDETAPIEFTEPQHPLLNYPNKITPSDFSGWVQERGLYYPQTWDSHYSAPLSTNDAKEPQLRGGLLAADYGRGHYIYTSMVWYRQLRAGIPGAYRVLANMISYGRQ